MLLDALALLHQNFPSLPLATVVGNHDIRGPGAEKAYQDTMLPYLSKEWNYKPVGFLSYSAGVSAGLRSVQATKLLVTSLKMMPMAEVIAVPFYGRLINENGAFVADEVTEKAAVINLDELMKWTVALKGIRTG